ncbi:MAG: crotonase/enoyl-CoA hydratase family protein [Maritimibacter sp.]
MRFESITIETDARGVATLTLARDDKHNALNSKMILEITEAAHLFGAQSDVRAVVLTGAGQSFCAGADLEWMRAQMEAGSEARAAEARALAMMLKALNDMPKPLIGRIQGQAYGGGVGMMSVCDVVIAADHCKFGFTEARLGLIPATIGPYVLARMGEAMARRVFMSARLFGAQDAVTLGLVSRAVALADLDEAVGAEVAPYLSCAPGAVAQAKALTRQFGAPISQAQIEHSIAALVDCWEGEEARAGIAAFFERREPPWVSS